MVPVAERCLHEARPFVRADEVAREDQRIAERRGAVLRVLIAGKAEQSIDVRGIHQRLRLIVEVVHVQRDFAANTRGAAGVELMQEVPSIAEARSAVGMIDRRQTGRCRDDLKRRVRGREISLGRDARGV